MRGDIVSSLGGARTSWDRKASGAGASRTRSVRSWQVASLLTIAGGSLFALRSYATAQDAIRTLGCEDVSDWSSPSGATLSLSSSRTQGNNALAIATSGYATVQSRLVGPLGAVADHISIDLHVPSAQPDPWWTGAIQAYVSAPSQGVYESYLGQIDLGALPRGAFSQLSFALSEELRGSLSANAYDISLKFALNVPPGVGDPYLLDNVQVSPTLPGITTIGPDDLPRVLGFEPNSDWSVSGGAISYSFTTRSQGNASLQVTPNGYTVVSSVPMTSLAPVAEKISFDLWVPSAQPNVGWWGAAQLYVSAPSLGLYNSFVGQKELLGLSVDQFNKVEFTLDSGVQTLLNSSEYSDLTFSIALNLPPNASPHYLDNLSVGQVTNPPAPLSSLPRPDYVGVTQTGAAAVGINGDEANVPVTFANFEVKAIDEGCIPDSTTVCRYSLTTLHVWFGSFSVGGVDISRIKATNNRTLEFALGGSHPPLFSLPSSLEFVAWVESDKRYTLSLQPVGTLFAFTPSDGGSLSLVGAFTGFVADRLVVISLAVTADSPLANTPPIANAGPDRVVTKASGSCLLDVELDGSESTDPENNLAHYLWTANGASVGSGEHRTVPFRRSGIYTIGLEVIDEFRSVARDTMLLTVNLPPGCPSL
jgi:hypothetical protein